MRDDSGLFPKTKPLYCDLSNADPVIAGEDGPSTPASLPLLKSISSLSIDSIYYSPSFLQVSSTDPMLSSSQEFAFVQGESSTLSTLPSTIPGDSGLLGNFDQEGFFGGSLEGFPLPSDEGWDSRGSGGDALNSVGTGY